LLRVRRRIRYEIPNDFQRDGRGEVRCALDTGAEYVVSNDSSCLMHLQGLLDRQGKKLKTIHLAEILAQT